MSKITTAIATIGIWLAGLGMTSQPAAAQAKADGAQEIQLRAFLEDTIAKHKLPGMVAAIADARGIKTIAAVGVRKADVDTPLQATDLMHIGSCTKAMTSTLLATLVAEGKLSWETTIGDALPELKKEIHGDYHATMLWQLVTHRGRFPANAEDWWANRDLELKARRLAVLKQNLQDAPTRKPGEYLYSNLGYMAAGCMAEQVTGKSWETLMKERLFQPLDMKSAGFGPPGASGKVDQPWGHVRQADGWQALQHDNAAALGPAGRVHCSLADWAKFVALQLPENKSRLLKRAALDRLIKPSGDYAAGWIVVTRPWAKGTAITHSGSNTMWYATVWVAPKLNRAFLVATNSSAKDSHAICDSVVAKLIGMDATN